MACRKLKDELIDVHEIMRGIDGVSAESTLPNVGEIKSYRIGTWGQRERI